MASSPYHIRRVPVPVRHPAPTSAPAPASAVVASASSSTSPQTGAPVATRGQHQPRAPIQLVNTHSYQPLTGDGSSNHIHQHSHQYATHTVQMGSDASLPYPLPGHVEKDIKAAVMASMPPPTSQTPATQVRNNVLSRRIVRWLSLSVSIFVVAGEAVTSIIVGITDDTVYGLVWASLLGAWNAWRLFRLRQSAHKEVISYWHLSGEITFVALTLFLLLFIIVWTIGRLGYIYYIFWRAVGISVAFFIWLVLHTTILTLTVIEMWRKHKIAAMSPPVDTGVQLLQQQQQQQTQLQQLYQQPQIIVQYIPTCAYCHAHVEPQPGEDRNPHLASIGDLQPQAVSPAYLVQKNVDH